LSHCWIFAIISRPSWSVVCVMGLTYICHFDIPFMSVHRVRQFLLLVPRFFGHSACRAQKQQHRVCCAVVLSKLIQQLVCVCVCVRVRACLHTTLFTVVLPNVVFWVSLGKPGTWWYSVLTFY
jgi:hypothetical protein